VLIVVGGNGRKVGKTGVVEDLLRAQPARTWTAIKITSHHRDSTQGAFRIHEELEPVASDTGRYLRAGAARAFLVEAADLEAVLPAIRELLTESSNTIIESNRILDYLSPDLCLFVLDFAEAGMKESCRRHLSRADKVVVRNDTGGEPPWTGITREWLAARQFNPGR
jgi:hypothetical protein